MLSASGDGGVRLWDLRTNRRKPNLVFAKPGGDMAREVQFSPFDSSKFAVIYDSGTIQRWDFRNPTLCERRINAHSGTGLSLDWHTEYDYIVSGGRDKQIQIWNMASESRKPEHVIMSPSPVAKVRWQLDLQHSNASSSWGVLNTDIVSCNMSLYDYGIYVWNPRRPYIPRYIVESHSNAVTDVFWRSNRSIWSISKDKTFRQHNLTGREMAISNMPSQAISWTHDDVFSFVVQDKHTEQYMHASDENINSLGSGLPTSSSTTAISTEFKRRTTSVSSGTKIKSPIPPVHVPTGPSFNQAVCTIAFPGSNPDGFKFCAEHYIYSNSLSSDDHHGHNYYHNNLHPHNHHHHHHHSPYNRLTNIHKIIDTCEHNGLIASHVGKYRVAQTWQILHDIISRELSDFLNTAVNTPSHWQTQGLKKQPVPATSMQSFALRISESLKGMSSTEATPKLGPVDDEKKPECRGNFRSATAPAAVPTTARDRDVSMERSISRPKVLSESHTIGGGSNSEAISNNQSNNNGHTSLQLSSSESDERDIVTSSYETTGFSDLHAGDHGTTNFTHLSMKDRNKSESKAKTNGNGSNSNKKDAYRERAHNEGTHPRGHPRSRLPDIKEDTPSGILTSKSSSDSNMTALDVVASSQLGLFEMDETNMDNSKRNSAPPSNVPIPTATNKQEGSSSQLLVLDEILNSHTSSGTSSSSSSVKSNVSFMSSASEDLLLVGDQENPRPETANNLFSGNGAANNSGDDMNHTNPSSELKTALQSKSLAMASGVSGSSDSRIAGIHDGSDPQWSHRYQEYLETLTHPWRAEKLIEQAVQYAMEQGDIQMCATMGLLFFKEYPAAFSLTGSQQQQHQDMVEEWVWTYLTVLRKHELHIVCAEIIKQSPFQRIRESGQIETALDLLCHRCMHPLNDNASAPPPPHFHNTLNSANDTDGNIDNSKDAEDNHDSDSNTRHDKVAFWYCRNCLQLLDGCIFCRLPVKGISIVIFECGHKMHADCMQEWITYTTTDTNIGTAAEDNSQVIKAQQHKNARRPSHIECPSGCQTLFAVSC